MFKYFVEYLNNINKFINMFNILLKYRKRSNNKLKIIKNNQIKILILNLFTININNYYITSSDEI